MGSGRLVLLLAVALLWLWWRKPSQKLQATSSESKTPIPGSGPTCAGRDLKVKSALLCAIRYVSVRMRMPFTASFRFFTFSSTGRRHRSWRTDNSKRMATHVRSVHTRNEEKKVHFHTPIRAPLRPSPHVQAPSLAPFRINASRRRVVAPSPFSSPGVSLSSRSSRSCRDSLPWKVPHPLKCTGPLQLVFANRRLPKIQVANRQLEVVLTLLPPQLNLPAPSQHQQNVGFSSLTTVAPPQSITV